MKLFFLVLIMSFLCTGCLGMLINLNVGSGTIEVHVDDRDDPLIEGNTANADVGVVP